MDLKKLAAILPLLYLTPSYAIEPFVVKDIRIEGIQRTEAGTVFSYLPVKVGDTLDDKKSATAIRALFATGFFKDVRLEVEQGVLVVMVRERPAIASVSIEGVSDFPKDQLRDSLKSVGLADGRVFDKSALDKAIQELKRQYVARGKYGVSIKGRVTELERNRVAVTFDVKEGNVSKILHINFVGNQAYSEDDLRDQMKLDTTNWWSWFSKNDQYSKQKFSGDLETIRSHYLDNGYLEFNIDSTQVAISPDKKDIHLTINLKEGDKYTISEISVAGGEKVLPHDKALSLLTIKPGEIFSRKSLNETTRKIQEALGELGYAFANVNVSPALDKERHTAALSVMIEPGQRVYVRRINITGNNKSRDEIIRREFRQMESAWFATSKLKKSKQRVDKLGYFSNVGIETPPVPGTDDQLDINVSVVEQSTGTMSIGAGLSSGEGLIFTGSISQRNLFGSGNLLSAQVNTSKFNQIFSISYNNPYYTDDGISRGFDVYKRTTKTINTGFVAPYLSDTVGAAVRFGVPLDEENFLQYGLGVENTNLGVTAQSPLRFVDYVNTFGSSSSNLTTSLGWNHDSRDSAIYTTQGTVQRASLEVSLPISSQQYYKLNYQHQWFYPLAQHVTLLLNGEAGYGSGYGNKQLPFFKYFYAGGIGSVRGYQPNSLGPVDASGLATGGTSRVIGNAELFLPLPGQGRDPSLRLSVFLDAGIVNGPLGGGITAGASGARYSTGVGLAWISPVGPLKFSLGTPLNKQPGDKLQKFQFTMGTMF